MIKKIYDNIYKDNNLVFIYNDENIVDESQSIFQILGVFELNEETLMKINFNNENDFQEYFEAFKNVSKSIDESKKRKQNVIFKVRLLNDNVELTNDLKRRYLLDSDRSELVKLLYSDEDNYFTWLSKI